MKAVRRYEEGLMWLLLIFMMVYPFIMGFHVEEPSGIARDYFVKKTGYVSDIFQYYKEAALIIFSVALTVLLCAGAALASVVEEKLPERYRIDGKVLGLTGVFLLLNILSCALGEYREYALMGLFLDYEGLAALVGYAVLFLAGYILLGSGRGMSAALAGVRGLTVLILIWACVECMAGPVFNIREAALALTPARYEHLLDNVWIDYHGSLAVTFSNPGYFGGLCALLCPVLYGVSVMGRRRLLCAFNAVLAGGLFFCIVMSGSSGAMYAAAAALAAETVCIVRVKRRSARYWSVLAFAAAAAVSFLAMGNTQIMKGESAAARLGGSVVNSQYEKGESVFTVDRITLTDGELLIESGDRALNVCVKEGASGTGLEDIRFSDGDGKEIGLTEKGGFFQLGNGYEEVSACFEEETLILDLGYQDPLEFYCYDGTLYYVDFNGSLLSSISQPEMKAMEAFYHLFTGRGYIWVSSLPILKECLFLGKGVGAFPFCFPQSEVAGMLNVHGSADYCIEIAHSWYLQTAVNGGVTALLCLIGLFLIHLYRGVRMYAVSKRGKPARAGTKDGTQAFRGGTEGGREAGCALFFGLLAFQIAGIVNNSAVTTAPVFWILFGCSMGYLVKQRERAEKSVE